MAKIAFMFSGQGAQRAGMGRSFYENVPEVRAFFDGAEALRPGTLAQCFEGDAAALMRTENTQPCLYLAELGAALCLRGLGVEAVAAAGFSLGEVAALAYGGSYSFLAGFRHVCRRGELMQRASEENPAAMAAVLRLTASEVEGLCEKYPEVWPVNYNSREQTVVAGKSEQLDALSRDVSAAGGRCLRLPVGGGFHSPLMRGAAAEFDAYLADKPLKAPEITVYSNYSAEPYSGGVREGLAAQIAHPVRWERIITALWEAGYTDLVEVGVGTTLKKLAARTAPEAAVYAVEDYGSALETARALKERLC